MTPKEGARTVAGGGLRLRLTRGRATQDPEKAVLPSIIYSSAGDGRGSAHGLFVGWWDFYVGVLWSRPVR